MPNAKPVEALHALADEFLFAKSPALAERWPTETRELLRSFCHHLAEKHVLVPGTPPAPAGPPGVEGPRGPEDDPPEPAARALEFDHPHRVEQNGLDEIDEAFKREMS